MASHPFAHIPDFDFSLGDAGDHPGVLHGWIDTDGDEVKVRISRVIVQVSYDGDDKPQEIDITKAIRRYPATREYWENEILRSWKSARDKEWNDGGDAA